MSELSIYDHTTNGKEQSMSNQISRLPKTKLAQSIRLTRRALKARIAAIKAEGERKRRAHADMVASNELRSFNEANGLIKTKS